MTLRIGEVDLAVDANTEGLRKATTALRAFGSEVNRVARLQEKGATAAAAAMARQESQVKKAFQSTLMMQAQMRRADFGVRGIGQATKAFNTLTSEMTSGRLTQVEFTRSLDAFSARMGRLKRQMDTHKASQAEQARETKRLAAEQAKAARTAAMEQTRAAREVARAQAAAAAVAKMNDAALLRQANAMASVSIQAKNLMASLKQAGASDTTIRPMVAAFAQLRQQMDSGVLSSRQYSEALNRWRAQAADTSRALKQIKLGKGDGDAVKPVNRLAEAMKQLESASVLAVGPLSGVGSRIRALSAIVNRSALGVAAFVGGLSIAATGLTLFSASVLRTVMSMERIDAMLTSVTRSSAVAANEFKFVTQVSRDLGLNLMTSAKGYGQLTAAARGTTMEGMKTRELFVALAQASSALQLSTDQFEGALLAVQQMMSKGTVQAEELRGQLGERLYGAFNLAAEAMGVTTKELQKMMAEGKVATDVFLPKLTEQLKKVYEEGSKTGAESMTGRINTLVTSLQQLQMEFNRVTGLSEKFKSVLMGLTGVADATRMNMDSMVKTLVGLAGAFIAVMVIKYAAALFRVIAAMKMAGTAAKGLSAILLATPWGRIAQLAGYAVAGLVGFAVASSRAGRGVKELASSTKEVTDSANGYLNATAAMRTALQDMREETTRNGAAQINALEEEKKARVALISSYVKFLNLSKQGASVSDAQKASGFNVAQVEEAKRSIKEYTQLQAQQDQIRRNIVKMAGAPVGENDNPLGLPDEGETKSQINKLEDLLKSIRMVREEIRIKGDALTLFAQGREDAFEFADAVLKAKEELIELTPSQVVAVGQALAEMGYAGATVTDQLAALYMEQTKVNESVSSATEALENYKSVLKDVGDVINELQVKSKAIELFKGGDSNAFKFADALLQAQDALKDLSSTQLTGVSKQLEALGYTGTSAAEQLAKLYMSLEATNEQMKDMEERAKKTPEALREMNMEFERMDGALAAMRKGSRALEAFEEMDANAQAVEGLRKELQGTNLTAQERNNLLDIYATKLRAVTEEQKRMAMAQELAQDMNAAFRDLVYNIGDAKNSLQDFFDAIHRSLTEKIVFEPLEQWLEQAIGNFTRGASKTSGGMQGNFFGSIMNGIGGLFGGGGGEGIMGLFGGGGGTAAGGLMGDLFSAGVFSGGGMVSETGPALVHKGEGVFTPDQINALSRGGSGVNVIVNNAPGMSVDYSVDPNGDIVIDVVASAAALKLAQMSNQRNATRGQTAASMGSDLNKALMRNG